MTLIELFDVLRKLTRPLLACEIIFYCVDQARTNNNYHLKSSIDQALCKDEDKRKAFSKNTITTIGEMEKSGILKKFSVINGLLTDFKGQPYPMAISLTAEVHQAFSVQSIAYTEPDRPES